MSRALQKYLDRIMIYANRNDSDAPGIREELKDHLLKLKRNQIQFATLTAPSLTEMNFARATINGISLFEEEVASLVNLHKERNKEDDKDYDKFSST